MPTATELLFSTNFENGPLFKNQQDLAVQLLNDRSGNYFIERDSPDYFRAQGRLKTYLSQLLSSTSNRNVTEDFKNGLLKLITQKVGSSEKAEKVVSDIVNDLKNKISNIVRTDTTINKNDRFRENISKAEYICVITSKPLEVDRISLSSTFSLKDILFADFILSLTDSTREFKYYRFNFPMESSAFLFWKGLKRTLYRFLQFTHKESQIVHDLINKFNIDLDSSAKSKLDDQSLILIADSIIEYLNATRYVLVIVTHAPIYLLPTIALDPSDLQNFKLYTIVDGNDSSMVLKLSSEEGILWRLFVWDQLKSKEYSGREIKFEKSSVDLS